MISLSRVALLLGALLLSGCSGTTLLEGAAKTIVTITLDGAPVDGAVVVFMPESGGRSASGISNPQGNAEMGTLESGDGVFPGKYKITIFKSIDDPSFVVKNASAESPGAPDSPPQIYLVPKKYISPRTSRLNATVHADQVNEVTLELTSS
ncbi:hypothetical protein [Blastopirellula marina]|uniref:Lipoprotein n=1 Tax=Blastopirellula marina DSM 3645 TaxID=314230 RepID=A3ZMS5_9BACT|nr:hypothetical protein [Blastopirellula marina]EAQ82251.1 hypothetical protein DSM3645_01015 [Blastopirellula marina DSM 3645]